MQCKLAANSVEKLEQPVIFIKYENLGAEVARSIFGDWETDSSRRARTREPYMPNQHCQHRPMLATGKRFSKFN